MKTIYIFLLIGLLASLHEVKAAYFHSLEATNSLSQPALGHVNIARRIRADVVWYPRRHQCI